MLSYNNNNALLVQSQLTPQIQSRNSNNNDGGGNAGSKMSPFLEPPGPRFNSVNQPDVSSIQWANPNGFLPSSHQFNNNARTKEATFRVTPLSEKPNIIPMTIHHYVSPG